MLKNFTVGLRVVLTMILFLGCFFAAGSGYAEDGSSRPDFTMGHDGSDKVIIARVNGSKITMTALIKKMYDLAQKKYGKREISPLVARKISNDAKEALIVEELAYQKSHAIVGELAPETLDEAVISFKKKLGGDKAFADFLKNAGLTEKSYRQQISRGLTVQLYVQREIDDKLKVTDEEIKNAYQGAKGKYFVRQEEVQVTDIILFLDPADPGSIEKAEQFRSKVINDYDGDPFKVPHDGTFVVRKNINLNKVASKERYDTAKRLGEGVLSHAIDVNGTLHIVQLTGYKAEISKDLEEVRDYLTREIKKRKRQELVKKWVAGLKEGADIEVYDLTR